MARQVEIALADSLRERSVIIPSQQPQRPASTFWDFLGNPLPNSSRGKSSSGSVRYTPPRQAEVKGLMQAFVDRSASIEAMWVVNAEGRLLYSSVDGEKDKPAVGAATMDKLRRGDAVISAKRQGTIDYCDVWVPLQMPSGVRGHGGLRLWINPADWTGLLSGMWRLLSLLFALGGGVALLSAFLTTALYTRRFRLISDTLRQAKAGTYAARRQYSSQDEVGASLDLIDRLVMRQRKTVGVPVPVQRLAMAVRTLTHEVKTPLNALAIHLEVLRGRAKPDAGNNEQSEWNRVSAKSIGLVRDSTGRRRPTRRQKKEQGQSK